MMEKLLGKITKADVVLYRGCYAGIEFSFSLDGGKTGISSGGKYTCNVSEKCNYNAPGNRYAAYARTFEKIANFLKEAGVDRVSKMIGMPVEVEINSMVFQDFRFLKEVL